MNIKPVNIGEVILQKVQDAGISKAKFAESLGIARQNIDKTIFSKHSIDTDLLCAVSNILECNLFDYYKDSEGCNKVDYTPQVINATITVEMGADKQDKKFRFVFGDNKVEIK